MIVYMLLVVGVMHGSNALEHGKQPDGSDCIYVPGDGNSESEFFVSKTSEKFCTSLCAGRSLNDYKINGATFEPKTGKCYCEKGQNGLTVSGKWRNCWFGKKYPAPPSACTFKEGDGTGGKEYYVGHEYSSRACELSCWYLKQTYSEVNGATISRGGSCYCETHMTGRSTSGTHRLYHYTSCIFGQ